MSKQELIELKKNLLNSKRYKLAYISKNNLDEIEIELFEDKIFFEEDLKKKSNESNELNVFKYIESSCEELIRLLAEKNLEYDEIKISISPLFYLEDKELDIKINDEGVVAPENLKQIERFKELTTIIFDFNIKNNNESIILPASVNRVLETLISPNFAVNYEKFAKKLYSEGYEINKLSFEDIYQARITEEEIGFSIEFVKEKEKSLH